MKKMLFLPFLLIVSTMGFSQELQLDVRGNYNIEANKEKLATARTLADVMPNYPTNWISGYVSVEITATNQGKTLTGKSQNEVLSSEQKTLLQQADLNSDIILNITYLSKNPVTEKLEPRKIHYAVTVLPDVSASFPGGMKKLHHFLNQQTIKKLPTEVTGKISAATVDFIVDESGQVTSSVITKTSGDEKTDRLLLDAVQQLPRWQPAKNNGAPARQHFIFSIGKPAGC